MMALNGKIAKAQSLTGNLVKSSGSGGDPNPVITRGSGANSIMSVNPSEPNVASGDRSIAIGTGNQATAKGAIAFGVLNLATAQNAIAIGNKIQNKPANQATNLGAIAIGSSTQATGLYAVSVGNQTIASGGAAFAAGNFTEASGTFGVATGYATEAEARYSAAFGNSTDATGGASFVIGAFNEPDANAVDATHGQESRKYIFIVGNGTDDSNRSNAMTVDWDGNAVVAGKLTVGAAPVNAMDVATKQYVDQQGGGGTSDYTALSNKPQINGNTLTGNKTAAALGLATPSDIPAAASSGTPAMDGTASRGSSTQYARADHVHPTDTSRAAASDLANKITAPSSPATGAFLVYNGSAWVAQTLSTWQGGSY
jgi:hypothetical protein